MVVIASGTYSTYWYTKITVQQILLTIAIAEVLEKSLAKGKTRNGPEHLEAFIPLTMSKSKVVQYLLF